MTSFDERYRQHIEQLRAGELPDLPKGIEGVSGMTEMMHAMVEHINVLTAFVRQRRGTW